MGILLFNTFWMIYNLYLAVLSVIFCWFLFKMPHRIYTVIVAFLWFLYLPNTIYVFSDLHHLVEQWGSFNIAGRIVLLYQYSILEVIGLTCFLVAFYPFEKILQKIKITGQKATLILIALNFLMGFAVVLGKFERVNSWDLFLNPQFVVISVAHTLFSYNMLGLAVLFGLFSNFFYFLFREHAKKLYIKWSQ